MGLPFEADAPVFILEDKSVYEVGTATDGERMLTIFEEGGHIRGMLADVEGNGLLPGMPYYASAPPYGWNTKPSVAFGGSHYMLAYSATPGIWLQRIDTNGAAVGERIQVNETGYSPKIGWTGTEFILVWNESDGLGIEVASTTVSSTGVVGETQIISIDSASEPFLATNAGGALVTWAVYRDYDADVEAVLLDSSGEIQEPEFLVSQGGQAWALDVATSGNEYLVAWTDETGVRAAAVSQQGAPSEVLDLASIDGVSMLALGANAEGYVVAWQQFGLDIPRWSVRRVSTSGELNDVTTSLDYASQNELALLGKEGGYWVVYRDGGVRGVLTDHDLEPVAEPTPLSLVKNSQDSAELAWTGSKYVLTWSDERYGDASYTGRMVRFDTTGQRLNDEAIALDDDPTNSFWHQTVLLDDDQLLVGTLSLNTWRESMRVVGADGTLHPPLDLGEAGTFGGVTLAAQGDRRLAVYDSEGGMLWGRLFDAQGAPVGDAQPLPLSEVYDARPHAGADGFLLQVGSNSTGTGLRALREDWTLGPFQYLNNGSFPVDVAVGGGATVVTWSYFDGVRVARFWEGEGWAGEAFTLGTNAYWGDTVWDGSQFVAVWQDDDYHSHWTTFDLAGNVATPEPLFRGTGSSDDPFSEECNGPKLASNGAGQCLLTCVRYDRDYSRRLVNYLVQSSIGSSTEGETSSTDESSTDESSTDANVSSSADVATPAAASSTEGDPASTDASASVVPTSDVPSESTSSTSSTSTAATSSTVTTTPPVTDTPRPPLPRCNVSPVSRNTEPRGLPFLFLAALALARRVRRPFPSKVAAARIPSD